MKKRLLKLLALLIVTVMAMGALSSVAMAQTTTRTHLNIVIGSLPVSLHHRSNDSPSAQVSRHIYDTLVNMCYDTFDILPSLAIAWEMPDPQTVIMELRQGVYFHNGDPLTAYDVQFSIDRAAVNPQAEAITGMISHVTVQDDFNFTIHLEVPFAPILRHLAHAMAGILPGAHYEEVGTEEFGENPVGTGPFMLANWVLGDRVELVRNDNYWGDLPLIETKTWREVPDPATRLIEVQTGGADVGLGISAIDVIVAEADPNVNLVRRQNLSTDYIGFNTQQWPFDDYRVRQAINYALDTETIVNAVWMGLGSPGRGPLSDIVFGFAEIEPFHHNMDRARELLTEAGLYPEGFETEIWWNIGNSMRMDTAEIVAATLREFNIDVTVHSMEWGTYLERTEAGESHMFILGWVSVTGDADYGLFPLFHSDMHGPNNRTFFSYAPLDALLEAGRSETCPETRIQIYWWAQQMIREQAPIVFLRQAEEAVAISPNLQGFVINPGGHHNYAVVWFD